MASQWRRAMEAIPWATIVANAPGILRSANALLAETKARSETVASRTDLQAVAERITAVEQRERESTELLTRVTAQVAELTTATQVLEARGRWLLVVAIAASVVALVAVGIAVFAR